MADTVIDSLVISLGLNASGFEQGMNRATEGIASFTKRAAGMFLAVQSIEGVIDYFKDLSQQLFHLGIDARNLDIAATKLSQWGEVAKLAGGNAEDAAATISGLNDSVFGLKYQGQLSNSLQMLQRFGIAYLTVGKNGEYVRRSFDDIAKDAARAIAARTNDPAERLYLAQQMGFTGGVATAISKGGEGLEEALQDAVADQKSLTEKAIQSQVALNQTIIRNMARLDANSSVLLAQVTPAISKLSTDIVDLAIKLEGLTSKLVTEVTPYIKKLADILEEWFGSAAPATDAATILNGEGKGSLSWFDWPGRKRAENAEIALEKQYGMPAYSLRALDWSNNQNPAKAAQDLAALHSQLGGDSADPDWSKTFAAYGKKNPSAMAPDFFGKARQWLDSTDAWLKSHGLSGPPATPTAPRPSGSPGAVGPNTTGMNLSGGTSVQIDSMTVNTRATDANGIAADMMGAIKRKILVSNADMGLA